MAITGDNRMRGFDVRETEQVVVLRVWRRDRGRAARIDAEDPIATQRRHQPFGLCEREVATELVALKHRAELGEQQLADDEFKPAVSVGAQAIGGWAVRSESGGDEDVRIDYRTNHSPARASRCSSTASVRASSALMSPGFCAQTSSSTPSPR